MSSDGRAVLEILAHLTIDGDEVPWPVAVVAESHDDRSVVFRGYYEPMAARRTPAYKAAAARRGAGPSG